MVKKLLVLMAASAVVAFVCVTVLGMIGGFQALNNGPWNFGPWNDWRNGRDPGPETTRDLAYSGSTRLNIYYPAEVTYTQGDQAKFTVTGPQYLLDDLRLEDGELTVGPGPDYRGRRPHFRWNGRYNGGRLRIEVTAPNLHEFHLAGAQELTLKNFNQDELRIDGSGAANIDGEGKAHRLEVTISGAGHVDLERLQADDVRVTISGAGDASLDARHSAEATLSGAGHVDFKCRPPGHSSYDDRKSGFGSIDYGPDCSTLPAPSATDAPPASSAPPTAQPAPAKPAAPPKSKV